MHSRNRPRSGPPREAQPARREKLQKVLASRGLGSRRQIEGWIREGRITVNGERALIGARVGPDDRIRVDGRPVRAAPQLRARILLLNKPADVLCTRRDPEGRASIFDDLPAPGSGRWISVGRLDLTSTGLLLLTNDGTLAHRLMHPSTGIDREYAVRLDRRLDAETERRLREGLEIDGAIARFSDIRYYDGTQRNHWYHVTVMEGRNREVRRLFEAAGVQVSRLKRVRYGPVILPPGLHRGRLLELDPDEVAALYELLSLPVPRIERPRRGTGRRKRRTVLIPYPALPGADRDHG